MLKNTTTEGFSFCYKILLLYGTGMTIDIPDYFYLHHLMKKIYEMIQVQASGPKKDIFCQECQFLPSISPYQDTKIQRYHPVNWKHKNSNNFSLYIKMLNFYLTSQGQCESKFIQRNTALVLLGNKQQ